MRNKSNCRHASGSGVNKFGSYITMGANLGDLHIRYIKAGAKLGYFMLICKISYD